jgi:dihydrolipoamide dehydrogenase
MRKQGIVTSTNVSPTAIQERPLVIARPATPRVSGLHLDAAGIQLDPAGGIHADRQQYTSQARIFAVGDCASGSPLLASRAIKQGKVAAEVIAGQRVQFDPLVTPLVVHTTPEIALVSSSARETGQDGAQVISGRFPLAANGRALTLGVDSGLALLNASADGTLLSATLVGPRAGDLLGQISLALEMGATLTDLSEILYAHPGLGEMILEASEQAQGKAMHILNKN